MGRKNHLPDEIIGLDLRAEGESGLMTCSQVYVWMTGWTEGLATGGHVGASAWWCALYVACGAFRLSAYVKAKADSSQLSPKPRREGKGIEN